MVIEADVFQMPQIHTHLNVGGKAITTSPWSTMEVDFISDTNFRS
jgi:hypothetical protein